jgi:transposase InsO family protein
MRYSQAEKMEIIRMVEQSGLSVKATLKELGINRSTFYGWYRRYLIDGYDGLADKKPAPKKFWNKIPEHERARIVEIALEYPEKSPRELAWFITDNQGYFISESSVYRILKSYDLITSPAYIVLSAKDKFDHPTKRVNELWQTDFSYFKIIGWGWYYLSTVMDDYSRFIIAWNLSPTMSATDVQATLDMALAKTGIEQVTVKLKPRLLSDNGPCYLSKELRDYLQEREIKHTRSAPYHPQTQGKIERYHRSIKNLITLQNYYLPGDLRRAISEFVDYYNNKRYHESLNNLIPADVFYGRSDEIIAKRETIKWETMQLRRYKNLENDFRNSLIEYQECLS